MYIDILNVELFFTLLECLNTEKSEYSVKIPEGPIKGWFFINYFSPEYFTPKK